MKRRIFDSIYYVGACDKSKTLFENLFPIPSGMRYNSYLIDDEKTALLDTVDEAVRDEFLQNIKDTLKGKPLDYLIVHHAEPDHSALISSVLDIYKTATLVTSPTALKFINQFSGKDFTDRTKTVKEGDTLSLGKHSLSFIAAPMVHWPEVIVSYESATHSLFSADAFGSFGSEQGSLLFSSSKNRDSWTDEARRYYSNIVGRFGNNVTALLNKAAKLKIEKILPLHGIIFDKDCDFAVSKYSKWSSYTPENNGVLIVYATMYKNTKYAADLLSALLCEKNIPNKTLDVSYTDISYIISDCFEYKNIVIASPTYYGNMFPKIEQFLSHLKKSAVIGRRIGFIENGTWAPTAAKNMKDFLADMKADFSLPTVTVKSSCDENCIKQIENLAAAIASDFS